MRLHRLGLLALTMAAAPVPAGASAGTEIALKINTAPAVTIAGTLELPSSPKGKVPLVILISGSGKQNRDASNMVEGYAPHRDWAELLARRGFASFRYDERGMGESNGDWAAMTIQEHAADIRTMIAELSRNPRIDPSRIILAGHSEGSLIATMLIASGAPVAGAILLAGPAWGMERVIDYQAALHVPRGGMSEEEYRAALAKTKGDFLARIAGIPNMKSVLPLDPLEFASKTKVPLLIVQGGADSQVLPEQAGELASAVAKGGNQDVSLRIFPGVNHLLMTQPPGVKSEEEIPVKTLAKPIGRVVGAWLEEHFGDHRRSPEK